MSWSQLVFTIVLVVSIFVAFGGTDPRDQEIRQLKQRVAALEKRTAPLAKICAEDDYDEAFPRLLREECDKR